MSDQTNILQDYIDEYLAPAGRHNFSREMIVYPRTRYMPQVPTNRKWQPNLQAHNWREFRRNADRHLFPGKNEWSRENQTGRRGYWIFGKYHTSILLPFLTIDIDRHHEPDETAAEFQAIEDRCWQQVEDVNALGLNGWWSTTPGDTYKGQLLHGLNYNLSFDQFQWRADLIDMEKRLHAALGWIDHESTTAIQASGFARNYRMPLQCNVNPCIVDSDLRMIQPLCEGFSVEGLDVWAKRPITTREEFDEILHGLEPVNMPAVEQVTTTTTTTTATTPTADRTTMGAWSIEQCLAHDDTFLTATKRKLCSRLTIKFRGKMESVDQAVTEGMAELTTIRPSTSKTCSSPYLLHATMKRWMQWYFDTFDSTKAGKGKRQESQRDRDDADRFSYHTGIQATEILACMKDLSGQEKTMVSQFYKRQQEYSGRVSAKSIYDGDETFCNRDEWKALVIKLAERIVILDEFIFPGKCRQWGFSKAVIREVMERREIRAYWCKREGDKEKKRETVYVVPSPNTTPVDIDLDFDALISQLVDEFTPTLWKTRESSSV